ncbi:amidase family protein [Aurantimonas sp. C2-3-R2]|uniref:amidase family protein n=1 Tax=Aurantimonas sp. C2-3-R2 TaxID=3114363 RepID=UPI003FA44C44
MTPNDSRTIPDLVTSITLMTRQTNFLGLPALVMPCGFTSAGLPVALQLLARPFGEATIFTLGQGFERATSYHQRKPPIIATRAGR